MKRKALEMASSVYSSDVALDAFLEDDEIVLKLSGLI
jgi:hypothetical protein